MSEIEFWTLAALFFIFMDRDSKEKPPEYFENRKSVTKNRIFLLFCQNIPICEVPAILFPAEI